MKNITQDKLPTWKEIIESHKKDQTTFNKDWKIYMPTPRYTRKMRLIDELGTLIDRAINAGIHSIYLDSYLSATRKNTIIELEIKIKCIKEDIENKTKTNVQQDKECITTKDWSLYTGTIKIMDSDWCLKGFKSNKPSYKEALAELKKQLSFSLASSFKDRKQDTTYWFALKSGMMIRVSYTKTTKKITLPPTKANRVKPTTAGADKEYYTPALA